MQGLWGPSWPLGRLTRTEVYRAVLPGWAHQALRCLLFLDKCVIEKRGGLESLLCVPWAIVVRDYPVH